MPTHTTTIPLARPARRRFAFAAVRRTVTRLARSVHDVWDGSSFEPSRHSLTRVQQPGEPQTPR